MMRKDNLANEKKRLFSGKPTISMKGVVSNYYTIWTISFDSNPNMDLHALTRGS